MNSGLPAGIAPPPDPSTITTTQPQQGGNWFTRALPTIGSIAAPVIGALLAPETGGLSLLASAALSGVGAGAGKAAENIAEQKGAFQGVPQEAAGSAITGGVLGGAGKILSPIGKFIGGGADIAAAKTLGGQFGSRLDQNTVQNLYANHGITDTNTFKKLADVYTGPATDKEGKAILNNAVENAVKDPNLMKVDVSSLSAMQPKTGKANAGSFLDDILTRNNMSVGNSRDAVIKDVSNSLNKFPQDVQGQISRSDLLQFQRDMSSKANVNFQKWIDSGRTDTEALNRAQGYNELSRAAESGTFTDTLSAKGPSARIEDIAATHSADATQPFLKISPEATEQLAQNVEQYATPINAQSAKTMADAIRATNGDVMKIRALQSDFVEGSKALSKAEDAAMMNYGTSIKDITKSALPLVGAVAGGGGVKATIGAGIGRLAQTPQAEQLGTKGLSAIANVLKGKSPEQIAQMGRVGQTLSRLNKTALAGGALGTLPYMSVPPAGGAQQGGITQQGGAMQGMDQNNLQTLYNNLIQQEQASPYGFGASGLGSLLSSIAPLVQRQALAGQALQGLGPSYQAAGGGQGLLGGLGSSLLAQIPGTPQAAYQRQQAASSALLGQLLGVSPGQASQLTPTFTMAPSTAGISQQSLGGLLSTLPTQ